MEPICIAARGGDGKAAPARPPVAGTRAPAVTSMETGKGMDDARIAAEIQSRGLELEYLQELAAALGYAEEEGWTEDVFAAIDRATPEQRRTAALRTLAMADD